MEYNITYRKKDKSIQCIISYKDEDEKWRQKSKQGFKAQKDAKPWIKNTVEKIEEQIKLKESIDPLLVDITFKEFMEKFISHKILYREISTVRSIKTAYNKFTYLDDMEMTNISKIDIQHCVDSMVKEGLALSTIKINISRMRTVFNYAIKSVEIIDKNPLDDVILPTDNKKDKKIKALNKAQLDNLLKEIEYPVFRLISTLAGTCGLRIGEIMGLTWDDIDLKESTLSVNKQWKIIREWEYGMGKVKRKNSNREIPIPSNTLNELKSFKKLYPVHTSKRIFYTRLNNSSVSIDLSKIYRKKGYDITIHDLRHTYATHLIANGLDYRTVAQLMGHDVQETIKTYSHVTDDMIEKATNVIEKIF